MMFDGAFGSAGTEVVIEEFLAGREISFFALCDGETAIPLASAQDHKRVFDHDEGPNTGGMGAYSPTPFVTPEIHDQIMARIILPTVAGMKKRGTPFRGVLYAGVMLTEQGPKLFEYNVRFGDPECQVLMLRMMSDIVPAFLASCDGELKHFDLRWYPEPALTVVMAAKGYPGDYKKGTRIEGLDDAAKIEGVEIFHAGTVAKDGAILANGGRVLNVCAMGKTVLEAQQRAYQAVDRIKWPDGFCRRDIAWQAVELAQFCRVGKAKRAHHRDLSPQWWARSLTRLCPLVRGYSKSPPTALAVVPCSRNALMTFLPIFHLCTSSGPSTSRCARTWVYHLASGVSWLKPSAPWSWIAVSITLCTMCAWKIFAIEFSCRISRPFSAL